MSDATRNLHRALGRARRSRRANFALPILDDPQEAAAVAREIAAKLASLPITDRPLLISDIELLDAALRERAVTLGVEMSRSAAEIFALNRGVNARQAYVSVQKLSRPPSPSDSGSGSDR